MEGRNGTRARGDDLVATRRQVGTTRPRATFGLSLPQRLARSALPRRLASHFAVAQHRTSYYLLLATAVGAAAGLVFWWLLARVAGLPASAIGFGSATVALGTMVGLVAKGGLDIALLRTVPRAGRRGARRLLRLAVTVAAVAAVALTAAFALATRSWVNPRLDILDWSLVAGIAALLACTWLQDAAFVAQGEARSSFQRNLVLFAARVALPLPIVLIGVPNSVAVVWAVALLVSGLAAVALARRKSPRAQAGAMPSDAAPPPSQATALKREFLRIAWRNGSGNAAEFLPGLLLAPLVLVVSGPEQAAYFGIAWAAASLLFLASAAMSRSALAELVHAGRAGQATVVRRAAWHHLVVVGPAVLLGVLASPFALLPFGREYSEAGWAALAVLLVSAVFVSPAYLYLALLRARDSTRGLVLFPLAMIAALAALAPPLATAFGLVGVAWAWLLANVPFGLYAAWRLWKESRVDHGAWSVGPPAPVHPSPTALTRWEATRGA